MAGRLQQATQHVGRVLIVVNDDTRRAGEGRLSLVDETGAGTRDCGKTHAELGTTAAAAAVCGDRPAMQLDERLNKGEPMNKAGSKVGDRAHSKPYVQSKSAEKVVPIA